MSSKWKKAIWAVMMIQLCLLHWMAWYWGKGSIDNLFHRFARHFSMLDRISWSGGSLVLGGSLVVSMVILVVHWFQYMEFRKKCILGITKVESDKLLDQLSKVQKEIGLKEDMTGKTFYCSGIVSPFVLGFQNILLLLPKRVMEREGTELLLRHECIHLYHRDTWYKLFMLTANCFLWFQPLAYLIRFISFRDIEIACDEAVVAGKDMEERKAYGEFLVESLRLSKEKGAVTTAFFHGGKRLMKSRIKAVMTQERRWDLLAKFTLLVLCGETCLLGIQMAGRLAVNFKESVKPENIYETYEKPESYSDAARNAMALLVPQPEAAYSVNFMEKDQYKEVKQYSELPYEAEGPWQVRLKDADYFVDSLTPLFTRFLYYDKDQSWGSQWDSELNGSSSTVEMVYRRLLAGDLQDSVWAVIFRDYVMDDTLDIYKQKSVQLGMEEGGTYAYFALTMHVKMVKDYVFELVGVDYLEDTMQTLRVAWPESDYSDVPALRLYCPAEKEKSGFAARMDRTQGVIQIKRPDSENWENVPFSLEKAFDRGDEMDGKLSELQEGSYQCDDKKILFAFGGSFYGDSGGSGIPVSVLYYDEAAGGWRSSEVTRKYYGGRRFFVSFPENSQVGYLIMTTERVMWQEGTVIFRTQDGGATWSEGDIAGPDPMTQSHSLTTDACFLTNEIGFLTIRDSDFPQLWRTEDGGKSWQQSLFDEVPQYYTMAYAPEKENGEWVLYVGMEEYSEYGGTKAMYITQDQGKTWEYQGLVLRK